MQQLIAIILLLTSISHVLSLNEQERICLENRPKIKYFNPHQITKNEAKSVLKKHYSEEDLSSFRAAQEPEQTYIISTFNKYVEKYPAIMNFREYVALDYFTGGGYFYLYDSGNFEPYPAYEMVRALINIAEKACHNHLAFKEHRESEETGKKLNCQTEESLLWRGEVRKRSDINTFIAKGKYVNEKRFVSFAKEKITALNFMRDKRSKENEIMVLYELVAGKRFFCLDFESIGCDIEDEREVVIFPNVEFGIKKYSYLKDDDGKEYVHIKMANEREMGYNEWRASNHRILENYRQKIGSGGNSLVQKRKFSEQQKSAGRQHGTPKRSKL